MLPKTEWAARLAEGADQLEIDVPESAIEGSFRYAELLLEWSRRVDLVSHTEPLDVLERHFLDSWKGAQPIPSGARIVDLGSGGGFPGLALRLIRPDLDVVSVESRTRKGVFQRTVCREIGLEAEVRTVRVEDLGERFSWITARALAPLDRLLPLALHVAEPGSTVLAYKGPAWVQEWDRCQGAGLSLAGSVEYQLPFSKAQRALVLFHVEQA